DASAHNAGERVGQRPQAAVSGQVASDVAAHGPAQKLDEKIDDIHVLPPGRTPDAAIARRMPRSARIGKRGCRWGPWLRAPTWATVALLWAARAGAPGVYLAAML